MKLSLSLLFLMTNTAWTQEISNCAEHNIDFIMIDGDANLLALEDDIRSQLAAVGFNVTARILSKEDFNAAHQSGDFHLSFTETWGAPYDPHSFAAGWVAGDEGHREALSNLEAPASRDQLFEDINRVLQEESHKEREIQWKSILTTVHQQAIQLPLWGKRIPAVLNNQRLTGYESGLQQFDYPVHRLQILSGSSSVTIAPGAQTGLFKTVGFLNPHTYRPNEFFSNNWIYEGLVQYGDQGQILPSLATSWTIEDDASGGQTYSFTLRAGVSFHDGHPWNCEAAKLNFDHALATPLRSPDYHGWYTVPNQISSWSCANEMEFLLTTKSKGYAVLQELTYIRPLRMLSPLSFVGNADPETENSCSVAWGTVTVDGDSVTCVGIANVSGTGPFHLASRKTSTVDGEDVDDEVVFVRNENHWEGPPAIETLVVVRYETSADVKAAFLDGSLDVVWGAGVLQAQDLLDLEDEPDLSVFHTNDLQNAILLLNSGKPPLDDIKLRKTIIHGVDKVAIIEKELGGVERPVDNVFPLDAPYCELDLTPRWDYDIEKALLLNCSDDEQNSLAVGLGIGLVCVMFAAAILYLLRRANKAEEELALLRREENAVDA